MIRTSQSAFIWKSVDQSGLAMSTVGFEQPELAGIVAIQNEVFAENANWSSTGKFEMAAGRDGMPVAPHQLRVSGPTRVRRSFCSGVSIDRTPKRPTVTSNSGSNRN